MNHAMLAPSSAFQWRWCAGSVGLSIGMGDEDTDASREGTAVHWVCEQMLCAFAATEEGTLAITEADFIDKPAENGVIIDEEMYDAALVYVRDIMGVAQDHGLLRNLRIEQRLTMPEIHEQCWGTPDCWTFHPESQTLYLWDFKYGHGSVLAFENWQMICYALGALREITNGQPMLESLPIKIVTRVVQPRCYDGNGAIREWVTDNITLRGYINQLRNAAELVFSNGGQCVTGPWCKNCDGAHHCPALRNAVAIAVDHSCDAIPQSPTNDQLGYELTVIERIEGLVKQRKDSLVTQAEHRIRKGELIPGRKLVQGYGKNKWLHDEEHVVSMGSLMGVDLLDKPKLLTPAKANEKLKKNNVDASVISSYYGKQPTSMKLVVDDGSEAKQIFSKGSI